MALINIYFKIKDKYFPDRKFRRARIWSNKELKKIAHFFEGSVINVSGWKDEDKRGDFYKNYFKKASSYIVSNYKGDSGFQGRDGEIYLDLEEDLKEENIGKFDVVFNHTTLEHIFDARRAFKNLCLLSRDIVIVVVPFLQELHPAEAYKDYWRFTPFAVKKLFEENGMELIYLNANNNKRESVYILAVGSKNPKKWIDKINYTNKNIFVNLGDKIIK